MSAMVSLGLGNIKPPQTTSMCAFPLPACQSCFINPLAGMSGAVPTSVLSCLPTISMSSHKIKSNYEQIPARLSPSPSNRSSTSGFHNRSRGARSCSFGVQTLRAALLRINLHSSFPPLVFHFDR